MCGISGFNFKDENLLGKMMDEQWHRGPDQSGTFFDNSVSLGHNRLSIIDLSEKAKQPMVSDDGNYKIIFNGEIYNFKELRKKLEKKYKFFSDSDTEVVLRGYEEYGDKIFGMLDGMWALAIYDKQRNELVLSRDYAGIKPLYYYWNDGKFVFASELAAIKKLNIPLTVNKEIFTAVLSFGFVPAPYSLYKEVSKVLPGEILKLDLDKKILNKSGIELSPLEGINNDKEIIEKAEEILAESAERHLIADVEVGLFLSGGNDSSLLAAILKENGRKIPAFCLEIEGRKDAEYARKVAERLDLKLYTHKVTVKDFREVYDKIFSGLKEPLADTAIFSSYLISRFAREKVKVVLSGEGGDELFGGYFTHRHLADLKNPKWPESNFVDKIFSRFPDFKGKKTLLDFIYKLQSDALGLYLNNLSTAYLYDTAAQRKFFHKLKNIRPFYYDLNSYLPDRLLYKLDYSAMAFSLEGRVPFLDKEMIRFSLNENVRKFSEKNKNKFILKSLLKKYLPEEIVNRPKEGFSVPLAEYFEKMPEFQNDYQKALRWAESNVGLPISKIKNAAGKTKFNLVALYKSLA
ncbi:MAG: asparagine synthase (glutamine-hydrolyzing) [Candidatus Pacebacteria bacterium]|nr:asparagine synthase (glutamine-hydrolyzing) [Candidatus Paceibacterota bacterium]